MDNGNRLVMNANSTANIPPTLEQKVNRLMFAVRVLATELDDADVLPRQSAEDLIERILYPEHFLGGTIVRR